jgi:HlyD family secretion protein
LHYNMLWLAHVRIRLSHVRQLERKGGVRQMSTAAATPTAVVSRRPRRRWLRWVILAILVAATAIWATRARWYGVPVTTVTPVAGPIAETVISSGRVRAASQRTIASTLAGRVVTLAVDVGADVIAGQTIATLDDADARAALARAEAALAAIDASRAQLDRRLGPAAAESLRRARAEVAQAERDRDRQRELLAAGAATATELERAETALDLARSRLRAATTESRALSTTGPEHALLDARAAEAQASIEAARLLVARHVIAAPADGRVVERRVEPGDVVVPGAPLLVLAEKGGDTLVIEPDEKFLGTLAIGQSAVASADAFPDRSFGATLAWIAPTVDPRRGTVEVRLTPLEFPPFLKPDMGISVEVTVATRDKTLTIPRRVVQDLATTTPWVLVVEGDRAVRRELTAGLLGDAHIEVTAGLGPTDRVIVPSPSLPSIGAKVRPTQVAAR